MQISNLTTQTSYSSSKSHPDFSKVKQAFKGLDSAMSSGNLSDAKTALEQLSSLAPKSTDSNASNNPMKSKIDALTTAVNSGDLTSAKSAYASFKTALSQRPSGPPPGPAPTQEPDADQSVVDSDSGKINITA